MGVDSAGMALIPVDGCICYACCTDIILILKYKTDAV
jgi:hypothetical protein